MKRKIFLSCIMLVMIITSTNAQVGSLYMPKEFKAAYDHGTRSDDGRPGEHYWQNRASYDLNAKLDPETKILSGEGNITYFNNSPDSLRFLILKLAQNVNKEGAARDYGVGTEQLHEGTQITSLSLNGNAMDLTNRRQAVQYNTSLYLIAPRGDKIPPGGKAEISIEWNYKAVLHGIRNGAHTDSAFFIGYWYPHIAVYDDLHRWDRENYTGVQETYNDLADYEVEVEVPEDYIVWATGTHLNEDGFFSRDVQQRIDLSRKVDTIVHVVTDADYEKKNVLQKRHPNTWKFLANDVPDFAWACSNYYRWDATSVKVGEPERPRVWVSAVYPEGTSSFEHVAKVGRDCIDYMSNEFPGIPYPFEKHVTFNGIHHVGMEYPMIANNGDQADEESYTELTIHEVAHNYLPFYVLSNERIHAWMDEGWVKLIGEKYGEKLGLPRHEKSFLNTHQMYSQMAGSFSDVPLFLNSGFLSPNANFAISYCKAVVADVFLLDVMKEKGVDNPLKEFIKIWKHKHPSPYDFFFSMNTLAGEDLSWFWKPWYFEFAAPDLTMKHRDGQGEEQFVVENSGGLPLPVYLKVIYTSGEVEEFYFSPSVWKSDNKFIPSKIDYSKGIDKIVLGTGFVPDTNPADNSWENSDS